ncbi:rieske family domain containing protein [Grosmannia clavigera kw1407]|uniref:Choline monooxygenase, chloroplastic n=1 Tax=Grosmannia clavigera (strain kw1407 / UAMH 11150) TaxID=655863 RepID=F0XBG0_GROCL|nr:rieske family domain containing protein [Grosmannia clavigera kw1407]EFX04861.1 rieske family domain containing protein [Grosmannia clavigera kw1407]
MFRFLGLSQDASPAKPLPSRGLASSWYRSPAMYELERRAVFSQRWLLMTHTLRFTKAGDYESFTVAGFSFFLVLDRTGRINGFHNICRHRAYPIVEKACGNAAVLSCKYHGWSYSYQGGLAKAPRFDTVDGFDRAQHGLLPVHVHVDRAGFVWVNLEAGTPSVPWSDDFAGVDSTMADTYGFSGYHFDHRWDIDLDANWKGVVENYNECYHCPTSHPLIAGVSDLTKYTVEPKAGAFQHTIVNKAESDGNFRRSIVYLYPLTSITVTDNFFYIQRMVPTSATTTRIENDVFRHEKATDAEFQAILDFYHQVLGEDKTLCDNAQANINAGVYVNGEFHPQKEKGPLYFQDTVRTQVMAHRAKEEKQDGRPIWPATPKIAGEMKTDKLDEEERFCAGLEAAGGCAASKSELAW